MVSSFVLPELLIDELSGYIAVGVYWILPQDILIGYVFL